MKIFFFANFCIGDHSLIEESDLPGLVLQPCILIAKTVLRSTLILYAKAFCHFKKEKSRFLCLIY